MGDTLDFAGPKGRYEYRGKGTFAIKKLASQGGGFEIRKAKNIGMIAGGRERGLFYLCTICGPPLSLVSSTEAEAAQYTLIP